MFLKWLSLLILIVTIVISFLYAMKHKENSNSEINLFSHRDRIVYLGAWVGGFWDNDEKKLDAVTLKNFEHIIGKKMAIANMYSEWSYLSDKKLITSLDEISSNGWVPMISSNPYFFTDCPDDGKSLYKTISDGKCDKFLRLVAKNLSAYEKPILFRFAWEMNLPNMYWSVQALKSTPEEFVDAWIHFHNILKTESVTNIRWVLSFNTSSENTIPYSELYPGDDYVDWVAIDGYNWGNTQDWSHWIDFNGVFRNSYNELTAITGKPVMLSEFNSTSTESAGNRAEWLDDMLSVQIPNNFPNIEAIVLFNEDKTEAEKVDWRLESSAEDVASVKESLNNKIYRSRYP